MAFDFPGNVRQLENICHWLTVMAPAQMIEAKDLPPELLGREDRPRDVAALKAAESEPAVGTAPSAAPMVVLDAPGAGPGIAAASPWLADLEREARSLLQAGEPDVWEALTRKFEAQLIHAALDVTRGRRIEAAQKLGIGRNTITRKIQELGLS